MVSAEKVESRRDAEVKDGRPSVAIPFGLLELDTTGVVRRYTPASGQASSTQASAIIGRNFFTEVLPVEEVKDCQARFYCFMAHGKEVHNFDAVFTTEQGQVRVQLMLSYIDKGLDNGGGRLAFIRITLETPLFMR